MAGHFSKIKLCHDDGTETELYVTRTQVSIGGHSSVANWTIEARQFINQSSPPTPMAVAHPSGVLTVPAGVTHFRMYGGGGAGGGHIAEHKKCECGKDKFNFFKHTDWCPIKD